jgi:hypothetical protein
MPDETGPSLTGRLITRAKNSFRGLNLLTHRQAAAVWHFNVATLKVSGTSHYEHLGRGLGPEQRRQSIVQIGEVGWYDEVGDCLFGLS